jgi:phosphomannomutase
VIEVALPPIVFGTDGWRARIAEDYTYDNVRRCAEGVARFVIDSGKAARGVVVGYDRRFSSEYFAQAAAEVLLAQDIPVQFGAYALPTQLVSYQVVETKAACGIVITASHNPWTDNGFKVKSETGAAGGPEMLKTLEATIRHRAAANPERRPFADGEAAGLVERFDPFDGYAEFIGRSLELERIRAQPLRVLVEPMWGCGAGWISRLLAGGQIQITELHQERNPWFGGVNPEPIRPNIDEVLSVLAGGGYDIGLLLDGDADRAGAADERGTFIHQLEVMGLLMYYLLEHRGLRQPVVSTINETSMVGRLGKIYGVPVYETSVGFKYVGPKIIETGAMLGGEESGGYGFSMHLPERDGIYADLLLLDLFIRERELGRWPVSKAVEHLHSIAGPSFYLRTDVHTQRDGYQDLKARVLADIRAHEPATVAGQAVVRTDALDTGDGFKFWLTDGSWLLIRFSGTEPLLRVYAEATSPELRDAILADGARLAGMPQPA